MVSVSPEPLQQGSSATICLLVRYLRFLAVESLRPEGGVGAKSLLGKLLGLGTPSWWRTSSLAGSSSWCVSPEEGDPTPWALRVCLLPRSTTVEGNAIGRSLISGSPPANWSPGTEDLLPWQHGPTVAMAPGPTRTAGSADIEDLVVFE